MTEICKVVIESGYFFLASQQAYYPHRRARWGNRLFLRGPNGTDWTVAALRFRDFVRFSQNYFSQIDRLRYWVLSEPLPNIREQDMDWGVPVTLWDNGGMLWPYNPFSAPPPYGDWSGGNYRGSGFGQVPLPPSVAYRYERNNGQGGRKLYGYLRLIESQFSPRGGAESGEKLPFFVPEGLLSSLHAVQITEPLSRSDLDTYHGSGSAIREVTVSHRGGVTSVHEVSGYVQGVSLTTARNFSLPVL